MKKKKTLWKKAGTLLLTLGVLFCALPAMNVEAGGEETYSVTIDFSEVKKSYKEGEALDLSGVRAQVVSEFSDRVYESYSAMILAGFEFSLPNGTTLTQSHNGTRISVTTTPWGVIPAEGFTLSIDETPSAGDTGDAHCSHDFEWEVQREATSTTAGLEYYKCKKCGYVKTVLEISGYTAFAKDVVDSISKAEANANVTFDTSMWVSFPRPVFDALAARPDVSLTVNYKFEGKYYTVTIPANADLTNLVDENGFCGFRNLDARFGGSEVVK